METVSKVTIISVWTVAILCEGFTQLELPFLAGLTQIWTGEFNYCRHNIIQMTYDYLGIISIIRE